MIINKSNIVLGISIAIFLAALYLVTCNKKAQEVLSNIPTSVPEQKERVRVDSIASQKFKDSVQYLISYWEDAAKEKEQENEALAQVNLGLQINMDSILTQEVPDTCKPYQIAVTNLQKKLAASTAQAQAACKQSVKAKDNIIAQKDALINKGKQDYTKLRSNLDTCFAAQTTLEKALKKYAPKRSIGVGIMSEAAWVQPIKFDMGLQLYYRGKNGNQLSLGVMTSQRGFVSYSKDLFKFK